MSTVEELRDLIGKKAEEVRLAKVAGQSAEVVKKLVDELLSLKQKFLEVNGAPFDPPKETKKEKPKVEAVAPVREGPSKKELNKLARKEKRSGGAVDSPAQIATSAVSANVTQPKSQTLQIPQIGSQVITYSLSLVPELVRSVVSLLGVDVSFSASSNGTEEHLPFLSLASNTLGTISGDINISRYFARIQKSDLYPEHNPLWASQVDQFLDVFVEIKANRQQLDDAFLAMLNSHLEVQTYLVGYKLSIADVALVLAFKRANLSLSNFINVERWFNLIVPQLPFPKALVSKASKPKDASTSSSKKTTKDSSGNDEEGTCPPLEGAIEGQVVTRFPPEPSGYLHIGHAKAVLLNQYYAQRYKGKLLVRFDDTNPSKEKEEYEENILLDLQTLGVKPDKVSHSSDHFATCEEFGRKLIKAGHGYMDDTEQEKMQAERLEHKESYRRNTSITENLELFELLLKGDVKAQKFCLRAKIDMNSVNGTMRDPVLYRFNDTPHHITGTKHKAYPTYDFACPIIDAIEGVTNALRTTEYNDRDEQYHWIQTTLGLRFVPILSFGKMNFIHTVLSKRKLNWFVENKLVEGWFDPRFPTIQGCVRRGMNIDALKSFILSQGASKRIITMEWDKFWSENKKILEETSFRYMSVLQDHVKVIVENFDSSVEVSGHSVPLHPSKPELGTRVMRRSREIIIDHEDALLCKVDEEITFLRWGNMRVKSIELDESQRIHLVRVEYDATSTNFSKTKKITWLANVEENIPLTVVEFDHLISKAKIQDEDNYQDHVNYNSRKEFSAIGDACLGFLSAGTVIQLERKGFFRVDQAFGGKNKPMVLFAIPDGKVKK